MVLFGYGIGALGNAAGSGWLHGLKVAAVAVVAQAVLGMARTLAPDRARATLAVAAAIIALGAPSSWGQIGAIALGGIVGALLLRGGDEIAPAASCEPPARRAAARRVLRAADPLAAAGRGDSLAGAQGIPRGPPFGFAVVRRRALSPAAARGLRAA